MVSSFVSKHREETSRNLFLIEFCPNFSISVAFLKLYVWNTFVGNNLSLIRCIRRIGLSALCNKTNTQYQIYTTLTSSGRTWNPPEMNRAFKKESGISLKRVWKCLPRPLEEDLNHYEVKQTHAWTWRRFWLAQRGSEKY